MLLIFRSCKHYAYFNVVYKKSVLNIMSPQLSSLSFIGLLPGNEIIIIVSGFKFHCDWNILLPYRFITISILNFFNIVSKYLLFIYNIRILIISTILISDCISVDVSQ